MKNKLKTLFKDIVIIWTVICTLLPTLFSGIAFAAEYINTERAGNYAANFAINFYENWSSVNEVEDGESRGGYVWPSSSTDINSEFGERVRNGKKEFHKGIDLDVTMREPLKASADGKIVDIFNGCTHHSVEGDKCGGSYGNNVKIDTGDCLLVYAHMTETESSLSLGDKVKQGQVIGYAGDTGDSTGLHCHFEILTNDISGLKDSEYKQRGAMYGYEYSVNPLVYLEGTSNQSNSYGVIKTEYDETQGVTSFVNEDDSTYKFSNKSWINFVYYKSLFKDDYNKVFSGAGQNASVGATNFNDKNNIPGVKDVAHDSPILDMSALISEGKILPGDILYVNKGDNTFEYLLYVGGTKVIYATNDENVGPSGALKYEYFEYYLQRIRKKLRKGHELEEDFEMPKYGVTGVYRIKPEVADQIEEKDANLFFNGKGYYSKVTYDGIPSDGITLYETGINIFHWLFDLFKQLIEFLLNLIIYIIRMQVIGWVNLFENLLQHVLMGISGDNNSSGWDALFGTSATSASGERVTVESIFFNKIPIFDANFFNFESAGGRSLVSTEQITGPLLPGQDRDVIVPDSDNVVYTLRKNLNTIYVVIRNLSIALLLFVLIGVGIKIAITSSAEKKADFKKFLISWLYGMCVVLFIHLFMYLVFAINDTFVGVCEEICQGASQEEVKEILMSKNSDEELNLYDAVRIKAYAFNWKEGVPATIIYIFLVYLLIRFSFIYFKRYLTIYILALSATFMGVKHAIERLMGKKTSSLNKWFKDFAFNVLLQTVHALIYVLFMAVAISVSGRSVGGALVAGIILNFMLQADKLIIKIFGLDKAGALADVDKEESWTDTFKKFFPMYTFSKGMLSFATGMFTSNYSIIRKIADFTTGADNMKDANKVWEMRKYKLIGGAARAFDFLPSKARKIPVVGGVFRAIDKKLPIRHYKMLGKDLSYDTNKMYYNEIKGYRKQNRQRFTRKLGTFKDLTLGTAGTVASLGLMIANPVAGTTMLMASRGMINKHKTISGVQSKVDRYSGTKNQAKQLRNEAKQKYDLLLDTYTSSEYDFQVEYNDLLDELAKTTKGSAEYQRIEDKIKQLIKDRKKIRAKELHELQEANERLTESKIEFGNAKHEKNSKNIVGKGRQKVIRGFEKVTGLDGIENIAVSESRASFTTYDSAVKKGKKLDDMAKVVQLEKELRELTQSFRKEISEIENNGQKISKEEATNKFEEYMSATMNQASKMNVSAGFVSQAVNDYFLQNRTTKIEAKDIDKVIDDLQGKLVKAGKKTKIDTHAKAMVKEALEKKMIDDNKGLGLEAKDASEVIRKALGKEGAVRKAKSSTINNITDQKVKDIQAKLLSKINEINKFNQVSSIKHKSALVNLNKIVKDAKKKRK